MQIDSVFHGDALDLLKGLPEQSVDLILTDMPYGITACEWDTVPALDALWEQFKRVIKPRCAIVCTASQPFTTDLINSNRAWFRYEWIWDKGIGMGHNAHIMPVKTHENILVFSEQAANYYPQMIPKEKKNIRPYPKIHTSKIFDNSTLSYSKEHHDSNLKFPISVISMSVRNNELNPVHRLHPTQKPVALFEYLIKTYTRPGDLVLDPFAGSGTTAVAARRLSRHYIVGDSSAEYVAVMQKRLAEPYTPDMFETLSEGEKTEQHDQQNLFE